MKPIPSSTYFSTRATARRERTQKILSYIGGGALALLYYLMINAVFAVTEVAK